MLITLRVIGHSSANALADLRATYTWRSWAFGWLGRMLAQVTFFVLLGKAVAGPDQMRYLVLGNALMTCVMEAMSVVPSSTWERVEGTLPLLVASPTRPVWVLLGRSLEWPVSGTATSLVALFVLGPAFGVSWQLAQVPLVVVLVVLTALGTYLLGICLSAVVLVNRGLRNVLSNASYLVMMAICGVMVPVAYWPTWVGLLADTIPLTHFLEALRAVAADQALSEVVPPAGAGVLTAVLWLVLGRLALDRAVARGRRRGTIDFTP